MANEIVQSFSEQLTDKLITLENALPKDFKRERFVQNALSVLNDKPELMKVNKAQLILGLTKGAMCNLDYSNREFYLIPYGNTVQFQFDYRGLAKIAKQYSIRPIKEIRSEVVRVGDKFNVSIVDNKQIINYEPIPFSDEEIVGVFAYIEFTDGSVICERMSTKDVNDVRNSYSKASQSKAWKNSWGEMARKTCLKRLLKTVELSMESAEAKKIFDEESGNDFTMKKPTSDEVVNAFAPTEEVYQECEVVENDDLPEFLKESE